MKPVDNHSTVGLIVTFPTELRVGYENRQGVSKTLTRLVWIPSSEIALFNHRNLVPDLLHWWARDIMDPQTIAIVIAIVAVGANLLASILPLLVVLIRWVEQLSGDVAQTNRVVIALANHRHDEDGAPTFILPAD